MKEMRKGFEVGEGCYGLTEEINTNYFNSATTLRHCMILYAFAPYAQCFLDFPGIFNCVGIFCNPAARFLNSEPGGRKPINPLRSYGLRLT